MLINLLKQTNLAIEFTMLHIGARPAGNEPFYYRLVDWFPGSRVIGVEPDETLCNHLNANTRQGIEFHPYALGSGVESRPFYVTRNPECSSLYKPDIPLVENYVALAEPMQIVEETRIDTVTLDAFAAGINVTDVDFIQIDIQGAELDVFRAGCRVLRDVGLVVSEVEFLPIYENQPLFGDVCSFLTAQDMFFHKFLALSGRALKPFVMNNNNQFPASHIWTDAVFIRRFDSLPDLKLLKVGVFAEMFGCPDVAFRCLSMYDHRRGTRLADVYRQVTAQAAAR